MEDEARKVSKGTEVTANTEVTGSMAGTEVTAIKVFESIILDRKNHAKVNTVTATENTEDTMAAVNNIIREATRSHHTDPDVERTF